MQKAFLSGSKIKGLKRTFSFSNNWDYRESLDLQKGKVSLVAENKSLFFCLSGVHTPVYTLGRSLNIEDYRAEACELNSDLIEIERGGKVMFHGPGQLTFYFIFSLNTVFRGPRDYVESLFKFLKLFFKQNHGINLVCDKNGLWHKDKKVVFMGIRISKGVAYHGISINYNVNLNPFNRLSPCDISGEDVGNLFEETKDINFSEESKNISDFINSQIDRRV